jgi:uncharacterized protein (DUF1778 family)
VVAVDERLDLKLSAADKQLFAQAAAIEGVTLSQRDFKAFHAAIAQTFEPNAALRDALEQARTRVSRV